jgi:hypothetical protein
MTPDSIFPHGCGRIVERLKYRPGLFEMIVEGEAMVRHRVLGAVGAILFIPALGSAGEEAGEAQVKELITAAAEAAGRVEDHLNREWALRTLVKAQAAAGDFEGARRTAKGIQTTGGAAPGFVASQEARKKKLEAAQAALDRARARGEVRESLKIADSMDHQGGAEREVLSAIAGALRRS